MNELKDEINKATQLAVIGSIYFPLMAGVVLLWVSGIVLASCNHE